MGSVTLKIAGMRCGSCVAHVERALKRTPGVEDASVNFAAGEATVTFDDGAVAPVTLEGAVRGAGYTVVSAAPERRAEGAHGHAGHSHVSEHDHAQGGDGERESALWRTRSI